MDSVIQRAGKLAESELGRVQKAADSKINRYRWILGLNGALAIAFGAVILIWPGISLYALTILFGAYAAASGILGLAAVLSGRVRMKQGGGWLVVSSLLGIGIGVAVLVWPNISALALLYVIGAYAIAFGIILAGGAFWLPVDTGDALVLVLSGFVSILFGIVMFAKPGDGALVLLALIAAFALVTGVSEVVLAIGGKRLVEKRLQRFLKQVEQQVPKPQASS
jgi:uncharacterized membrane protein HdeD (DUF308 family)